MVDHLAHRPQARRVEAVGHHDGRRARGAAQDEQGSPQTGRQRQVAVENSPRVHKALAQPRHHPAPPFVLRRVMVVRVQSGERLGDVAGQVEQAPGLAPADQVPQSPCRPQTRRPASPVAARATGSSPPAREGQATVR
ncbi:hypothetical protein [Streptomyces niveus]|uniref:hypothetical protein n=1 Tax=Streptomyces niveus TaxID=193462 RepID=UPI00343F6896